MEILKELKPAEIYFLMNWMSSDEKLMGYTLGTLIMEKCFEIKYVKRQVHVRVNKFSTYKMITPSTNFRKEDVRSYEKPIFELMGNDLKREVQVRLFMKAIGSTYWKDRKSFRDDYLGKSSHMHDYYQDNFLLKYFDRRTSKGKKLGDQLNAFFKSKDEELKKYQSANDDESILKLVEQLGVHIILLSNLDNDIMQGLKDLYKKDHSYFSDFAFVGGSFSDFSDSFDSFDGFGGGDFGGGGAGGSWGGGDSGCSSCSGCGGCGGCGGCS